jgi:hypothetical protein
VHWSGCGRSRYPQGKIWLSVFDHRVFERHLELNATHATISTNDKYVFVSQESTGNTPSVGQLRSLVSTDPKSLVPAAP